MEIIKTISFSQQEILSNIMKLYCPDGFECDPTYSKGFFYKNLKKPEHKFDINPQTDDTIKACATKLPLKNRSINNIVFDPPFVATTSKMIKPGSNIIQSRYSAFPDMLSLRSFYFNCLVEFHRVLKLNGILIFKCQDSVSDSNQYMNHCHIWHMARDIGYKELDLFILLAKNRLISGNMHKQQHARKFHSYFLVLLKQARK